MINYLIIGAGWRAEFYLRIAKLVPEKFKVTAVYARNSEKAKYIAEKYNVKVINILEDALKSDFDFIVNCINKDDISNFAIELAKAGYYVLCETPVISMSSSGPTSKIQVAEQFHLKGTYQALKKLINSGTIGKINYINISVAHDYHAMSLIRFLLDCSDAPEKTFEYGFDDRLLKTNGRLGEFSEKYYSNTLQNIKIFKFGDKTAVYDYTPEQYFSPIRNDRLLIRGTRGEIENTTVRYFNENNEFCESDIIYHTAGLLDGFYNDKITFENKVLFDFPFKASRLSEEETAIAECLIKMKEFIETGREFYSFEEAYKDYIYFK